MLVDGKCVDLSIKSCTASRERTRCSAQPETLPLHEYRFRKYRCVRSGAINTSVVDSHAYAHMIRSLSKGSMCIDNCFANEIAL